MVRYEQGAYGLRAEGKALMPDRLARGLARHQPARTTAMRSSCRRATASAGPTSRTSSTRASTPTRTCSRTSRASRSTRSYREDGDAFVGPYLDFLSIGGAASPQEQLAGIGLDISRDDCWDAGFAEIERLIEMAEAIEPE